MFFTDICEIKPSHVQIIKYSLNMHDIHKTIN